MLVTVDGATTWIFHTAAEPTESGAARFTPRRCRELVRAAVGSRDLDVAVLSILPWQPRGLLADRFGEGRVLLIGDAAHAVPPVGAFGLNTGIADAHNLAWKLAAVLDGRAGSALVATYQTERRPVAAFALEQSLLRLHEPRLHWEQGPQAAAARAEAGAANASVVHLGYRYDSTAVVDARPEPPSWEHAELNLDGAPGSRLPHAWLESAGPRRSTLDLVRSEFTLLTGPAGSPWLQAAEQASARLGLPMTTHQLEVATSPGDPTRRWPGIAGIAEDGALLVRPDQFIAWRRNTLPDQPSEELTRALRRVLAREQPADAE
ncbi:hypothetical protein FHR81_000339 [Actinoalloteichus hoggarensis]|uniref:2,4-dichlorophenol 6-monooxygenase n=2 Tax=Actinoalloteichus hoggarensis TaxID=1470176 RepID=A0A221W2C7_9PSEU|nr:2,4-dichlorophenol 6-monooxygenase [Actinoalloteichus hoggarensis]MBB5919310.1 hypothetical protein [Actinoalloteichus hoggarensis]